MTQRHYSPTPLGERLRRVSLEGFVLTEAVYQPSSALSKHVHDHAIISIVLKGSYTEFFGSRPHECGPYSVLLKAAGEDHNDQYGRAGARCLIIKVEPNRLESIRSFSNVFDRSTHVPEGAVTALAIRLYQEFKIKDSASALSVEGLVLELLGQATRRDLRPDPSAPPPWLRSAESIIRDQFNEPIGLMSVAAAVEVHPSHLARMFRKFYGCTMGDFLRRVRLEHAVQEISRQKKSLAEVALGAGFCDQSHLTKAFKANLGMTPAKLRSAMRAR